MKRKTITLLGRELVLHQRFAADILASMDLPNETDSEQIKNLSIYVSDALKENWMNLKGKKKKRAEKELSPAGLLGVLTVEEIIEYWNQVAELEDLSSDGESKKK